MQSPFSSPLARGVLLKGVIDLIEMTPTCSMMMSWARICGRKSPFLADMQDLADEYREKLMEAVSEVDDEIMELYLAGEEDSHGPGSVRPSAKATIDNTMVPVTCGSSYRTRASRKCWTLWWTTCRRLWIRRASRASTPTTEEEDFRPASDDAPFSALAFKIATDPFVGSCASSASIPAIWPPAPP